MSEQEIPTWGGEQPVDPKPANPKPRWSGKKTAAAVAIAVGVAAAGGVAVYAASGSAGATASQNGGMGGGPGGGMGGMGRGGGMGELMNAVHGEFTVSDGKGGYQTEIMQTGSVTAVSSTSLTAKSSDGYTKVYTINASTAFGSGTVADIKTGDTVTVVATPSGDNATADSVLDRAQMPQGGQGGPPGQGGNGQPGN
jgi:hypothetical protein